jgi:hypothetical protein
MISPTVVYPKQGPKQAGSLRSKINCHDFATMSLVQQLIFA